MIRQLMNKLWGVVGPELNMRFQSPLPVAVSGVEGLTLAIEALHPKRLDHPVSVLPFPEVEVCGGGHDYPSTRAERIFRPVGLWISSDIASDFDVFDVRIANKSQFMRVGPVPAELFSPVTRHRPRISFETMSVGEEIRLHVRNNSVISLKFRAAMFGYWI